MSWQVAHSVGHLVFYVEQRGTERLDKWGTGRLDSFVFIESNRRVLCKDALGHLCDPAHVLNFLSPLVECNHHLAVMTVVVIHSQVLWVWDWAVGFLSCGLCGLRTFVRACRCCV